MTPPEAPRIVDEVEARLCGSWRGHQPSPMMTLGPRRLSTKNGVARSVVATYARRVYGSTNEWIELAVLFLFGPLHALASFTLAGLAFFVAGRFPWAARVSVLIGNAVLAAAPISLGRSLTADAEIERLARMIAVGEATAVLVLAAALLMPRSAKRATPD